MNLRLIVQTTGELVLPKTIIIGDECFEMTKPLTAFNTKKLGTVMSILKEIGSTNIEDFTLIGRKEDEL